MKSIKVGASIRANENRFSSRNLIVLILLISLESLMSETKFFACETSLNLIITKVSASEFTPNSSMI